MSNKNKLNSTAVVPVVVNKKKLQLKQLLSEEDEKVDSTSTSSGISEKTTTNAAIAAAEALEIKAKKDAELAVKKSAKPAEKKEAEKMKTIQQEEAAAKKKAKETDTKSQTNNANDLNIRVPSRDEIDQFRKQIRAKIKNDRNKLKKIFDKLDNNKSDTLCKQEFGNLVRAVMQEVPSKALLAAIWSDATSEKKELDIKNWIETTDEKKELDIATLTEWVFISTPEEMAAAMLELDLDSSDEELELPSKEKDSVVTKIKTKEMKLTRTTSVI